MGGGEKQQPEIRLGLLGYSRAGQTTRVPEVFFSFAEIHFGGDVSGSALPTRLWPKAEAMSGEVRGSL